MPAKLELQEDLQYDGSTPLKRVMQEMFINNLLSGMSQAEAYRKAGYKSKNATNGAIILQRNSKVQSRIRFLKAEIKEKNRDEISEIKAKLREKAFDDTVSDRDQLKALELLGKTEAMFSDKLIVTPEIPCLSPEETLRLRQQASIIDGTPERKLVDNVDAVVV